jgi:hypothetical protein
VLTAGSPHPHGPLAAAPSVFIHGVPIRASLTADADDTRHLALGLPAPSEERVLHADRHKHAVGGMRVRVVSPAQAEYP